jgi:hypothetical protein
MIRKILDTTFRLGRAWSMTVHTCWLLPHSWSSLAASEDGWWRPGTPWICTHAEEEQVPRTTACMADMHMLNPHDAEIVHYAKFQVVLCSL